MCYNRENRKIGFDPISEPIPNCQCMKYTCQHLGVCGKSRPHLDTIATCSAVIEVYNKTMRIIGCYEVIIGVPKVYAKFLKRFGFWSKNWGANFSYLILVFFFSWLFDTWFLHTLLLFV